MVNNVQLNLFLVVENYMLITEEMIQIILQHMLMMKNIGLVQTNGGKQKKMLLNELVGHLGEDLTGLTVAVWGLAFKPNTDDMREAVSLVTIQGLLDRRARVVVHDPVAFKVAENHFGDRIEYAPSNLDALEGASALIIHTEWQLYRSPDFTRMIELMKRPLVLDGRNVYSPASMARRGFEYVSIGRPSAG